MDSLGMGITMTLPFIQNSVHQLNTEDWILQFHRRLAKKADFL